MQLDQRQKRLLSLSFLDYQPNEAFFANPLIVSRASGLHYWDTEGKRYFDGIGGIFVEVLKDVVFELTPLTDLEAEQMLDAIKGAPLLSGVRGQEGVDRASLANLILRLSQLVTDLPQIQEMDLNPVIVHENGISIVDARMLL